jgi:hypothetical protein
VIRIAPGLYDFTSRSSATFRNYSLTLAWQDYQVDAGQRCLVVQRGSYGWSMLNQTGEWVTGCSGETLREIAVKLVDADVLAANSWAGANRPRDAPDPRLRVGAARLLQERGAGRVRAAA